MVDSWADEWWWCHENEVSAEFGEVILDGLDIKFGGWGDIESEVGVAGCEVME